MDSCLENIDAVFLDLDGTIYLGGDLIDGALDFLSMLDDLEEIETVDKELYEQATIGFASPGVGHSACRVSAAPSRDSSVAQSALVSHVSVCRDIPFGSMSVMLSP